MTFKIKAITPKNGQLLDPDSLKRAIENALTGEALSTQVDFGVATQTWNNKPEFKIEKPKEFERLVVLQKGTKGANQFIWVNFGTRKNYPIVPKKPGGFLRFQGGYNAKTTPRVIASKQGGSFGSFEYRRAVIHPGIEAREFDQKIAEERRKLFPITMQRAIDAEVTK